MARFFIILISLTAMICTSSWAKSRDEKIEELLEQEGYVDNQSSVHALLALIWAGDSWGDDTLLPYYNLERFAPYSFETSNRILDTVKSAIRFNQKSVNVTRLLQAFYVSPVSYPRIVAKLESLLDVVKTREDRLLLANILLRYPQTRERAVEVLRMTMSQTRDVITKIQVAYTLLSLNEHVAKAEDTLISLLKSPETATRVLAIGSLRTSTKISERLYNAIREAMNPDLTFPASGLFHRLTSHRAATAVCEAKLDSSLLDADSGASH